MGGSLKRVPKNRDDLGDGSEPVKLESVSCHSHGLVAASKPKALGMVNTGRRHPQAALEAAALESYQIKFDRLLLLFLARR